LLSLIVMAELRFWLLEVFQRIVILQKP